MKEIIFLLTVKMKESLENGIFATICQFLKASVCLFCIKYFQFVKKKQICVGHQTVFFFV